MINRKKPVAESFIGAKIAASQKHNLGFAIPSP